MNKKEQLIKEFQDRISYLQKEIEDGVTLSRELEIQIRIEEVELCLGKVLHCEDSIKSEVVSTTEEISSLSSPINRSLSNSSSEKSHLSNSTRRFHEGHDYSPTPPIRKASSHLNS